MKLQKIKMFQNSVQKKIIARAKERQGLVNVSKLADKAHEACLTNSIPALETFAYKNGLVLNFYDGKGLFKEQTTMKVFRENYFLRDDVYGPVLDKSYECVGESVLDMSSVGKNPRNVVQSIKDSAKALIENLEIVKK